MFWDILKNDVLWIPFIAWLVAQLFKTVIYLIVEKRFDIKRLFGDGGMPSGHSATVSALAVMCGYVCGIDSAVFAVSVILMIIVMKDAMGVRREAGKQAVSIKELADIINQAFAGKTEEIRTEKLNELISENWEENYFGEITVDKETGITVDGNATQQTPADIVENGIDEEKLIPADENDEETEKVLSGISRSELKHL